MVRLRLSKMLPISQLRQVVPLMCLFSIRLASAVTPGDCSPPTFDNGHVETRSSGGGTYSCGPGYSLVGNKKIKCRDGRWSSGFPVCTAIGICDPMKLPELKNGKRLAVKQFRKSVYRYSCNRGFNMVGPSLIHCKGDDWNLDTVPICTRLGCDQLEMEILDQGIATKNGLGEMFSFQCNDHTILRGSPTVFCDGDSWNDTAPLCLSVLEKVTLTGVGQIILGETATFTCESIFSNPPAIIQWTVTDQEGKGTSSAIKMTETSNSWSQSGSVTTSKMVVKPVRGQTSLKVRCFIRSNKGGESLVEDSLIVSIQYPPESVSVTGPSKIMSGTSVSLVCSTSPSKPAADLHWRLKENKGEEVAQTLHPEVTYEPGNDGSFISSSTLLLAQVEGGALEVECYASNSRGDWGLQGDRAYAHFIDILAPPSVPEITSHQPTPDEPHYLSCRAKSGNPPATLTWTRQNGDVMEAQLTLEGDTLTAFTKLEHIFDQEVLTCTAENYVSQNALKSTIMIDATVTTTSTTTPSRPPTPSARVSAKDVKRIKKRVRKRPVVEMVADMPAPEEDIPDNYDYSHFSYINEKFDNMYQETAVQYPSNEIDYYSEDYIYIYEKEGSAIFSTDTTRSVAESEKKVSIDTVSFSGEDNHIEEGDLDFNESFLKSVNSGFRLRSSLLRVGTSLFLIILTLRYV